MPVLLEESLGFLAPETGGCYVDCTLGLGGHTWAMLERFPEISVVGIDRDPRALALAGERLARFGDRVQLVEGRFDQLEERLGALGLSKVRGILADLGVSSMQLDEAERGFSFSQEGPLDMRMGSGELTAADIVNEYPEESLTKILKEYGEEPQARRIARAIVEERKNEPFETTADLCRLVENTKRPVPRYTSRSKGKSGDRRRGRGPSRPRKIHPATQVFQALRIEVNQELRQIEDLLEGSLEMLEQEGRLVVISYQSLEDRIVKHRLRDLATGEIEPVTGRPRAETQVIEVLTRKPVRPSEEEVAANPRARSARLRAARRL